MTHCLHAGGLSVEALASGALRIIDTQYDVVWGGTVPGWATVTDGTESDRIPLPPPGTIERRDDSLTILFGSLRSPLFGPISFRMCVRVMAAGNGFDLEISDLQCAIELVSVEYPAHLLAMPSGARDAYLAVPFKQGVIIPSRLDAGFMRFMHNTWRAIADIERTMPFDSGALNMPWFGAARGASGIFAHVATSADCSLRIIGNAVINQAGDLVDNRQGKNPGERISSLGVVWSASHGQLAYPRRLRIERVDGGYVGMAGRYREIAVDSGRHRSLQEKIDENPSVRALIGAPDIKIYIYTNRPDTPALRAWSEPVLNGYSRVHTTFDQVGEMAADLQRAGIDRSLILLAGWNKAGYDREHVAMWPPAEGAGGAAGLSRASRDVTSRGFLFSLHDNYQDFYTDAPGYDEKYLMKDPAGRVRLGGVWDGGLCRLICSSRAQELAEKNLDIIQSGTMTNSYYLDTTTASCLFECFDASHPLTRSDDRSNKLGLLTFLKQRGLVVGGEGGTDWAVPVCSYFEGLPGSSFGYCAGIESADFGIAAPLFSLVYHDAVVCYWQHGQPHGREDHANHVLHDLLEGQPSSWSIVHDQWEDLFPLIRQTCGLLGTLHRQTAFSRLLTHAFLTPDFAVQRSRFANGTEVVVNYGITTVAVDGTRIPPKGFRVRSPGVAEVIGGMSREIVYR